MSTESGPAEALSPFAAKVGAIGSPPQHYGNPLGEQRQLAAGSAIVDLSDRAVLTITGPDRLSWLNSLTSQAVTRLAPGESAETLLLDQAGHLEYAVRLLDDGVTAWLLLERSAATGLHAWLDRMRFMLRVELADRSDDFATIGTLGDPTTVGLTPASPNGVPLAWRDPWQGVVTGGHQYATAEHHPGAQWTYTEVLIERDLLADAAALPAAGTLALEALRVAAWRPRLATEADERTIPHELDWLRTAVHLTKGCYRGQETVAKVHNLGHPPRRLVLLHLDGSEGVLPGHGDTVTGVNKLGETVPVGSVTSAVLHYELGPIALAVIKRSVDPSATLVVLSQDQRIDPAEVQPTAEADAEPAVVSIAAAQEIIVPTDAGAEANVPRLPRLGAVRR